MRRKSKYLDSVNEQLCSLAAAGVLGRAQLEKAIRILDRLHHGAVTGSRRSVVAAVNELCKLFVAESKR